ncbi:MAG: histidine--tRNA ligase [Bacteroidetes bacterium GWE2_39_28]|nr:MAG: histidine--tRNA ligase [Bacteroidetes bacterium GWE2_39_28]OFY15586.1 MAG: histidine--tRNA ligase [Bacteroidetes bacterium GWF2_39_10]OFZ08268.1 MAG: histidine--tRNA ligase [Bacteroidetes bacterium RIFOXYB2_FULL_39_7]OFZ10229.1 MAG: histidine--tRNA ligase [Bacteroidetes bacterium RIFOXYC2_FULL_39_11]HCT94450.1 histidine--tRNA ligase [Rikenellaceae bacterium]
MAQKPSIPKGTRDFGPSEMAKREYIFDTVKSVFKLYGYSPIETPAMENLSSLLGKYGEEGDRLLFKVLNSGDAFAGVDPQMLQNSNSLSLKVCEKGLRYDLTVPFARFVVQHQNEITFPFKRYQIQPVWRADRPQKGRYREFFQCDVDVIGSTSLLNELELIQITDEVFKRLGIDVTIKINNRKILSGIAEVVGHPEKLTDITIAIDKIDKIGLDEVKKELLERGIDQKAIDAIEPVLNLKGTTKEKIEAMKPVLENSQTGMKGLEEIGRVFELVQLAGVKQETELDLSLARGLNYYTGAIFEVKAKGVAIGSICGGGRYDDLTGIFGLPGVSGVGISFGADRIYDVLNALERFPAESSSGTKILFANLGEKEQEYIIPILKKLREAGVASEIYTEVTKLKKQFDYAEKRSIPYLVIAGESEILKGVINLKNLATGEQVEISPAELIARFL